MKIFMMVFVSAGLCGLLWAEDNQASNEQSPEVVESTGGEDSGEEEERVAEHDPVNQQESKTPARHSVAADESADTAKVVSDTAATEKTIIQKVLAIYHSMDLRTKLLVGGGAAAAVVGIVVIAAVSGGKGNTPPAPPVDDVVPPIDVPLPSVQRFGVFPDIGR